MVWANNKKVLGAVLAVALMGHAVEAASFPYALRWKRLVGTYPAVIGVSDSLVAVGSPAGEIVVVGREDGVKRWRVRGYGALRQAFGAAGSLLFYADTWGQVEARSWLGGETAWSFRRLGRGAAQLVVGDTLVYAAGADGWLYALAAGQERWRLRTGNGKGIAPVLTRGRLYVAFGKGLNAVNPATGLILGGNEGEGEEILGLAVAGRRLAAGCSDGYMRVYTLPELGLLWQRRLGTKLAGPPLAMGRTLVGAGTNGWIYGLDRDTGAERWRWYGGEDLSGPAVVGDRGEVIVATKEGLLTALDPAAGTPLWELQFLADTALRVWTWEGWLYISGADGFVYAFAPWADAAEGVIWEDWWATFSFDRKTGYARQWLQTESFGEVEALRLHSESVAWRSGYVRSISNLWVDKNYRPLAFTRRRIDESQVGQTSGTWQGGRLRLEQRLAGRGRIGWYDLEVDVVLPEVLTLKLAHQGKLVPGLVDTVWSFDYASAAPQRLEVAVEGGQNLEYKVRLRYVGPPADSLLQTLSFYQWVDEQGRLVHSQSPGLGAAQVKTDGPSARAWIFPGPQKGIGLNYGVERPAAVDRLVLRLPAELGDPRPLLVVDQYQQVLADSAGTHLLVVERRNFDGNGALELPIDDPQLAPFLAPSLYIQAEDKAIGALARHLRGEEKDAWSVAQRLRHWVYNRMIPKDTNVRFKSAVEVLEDMEGTCSEYTVLYVALCRAVGIPARVCVGFVVSPSGRLILHIWSQVFVGSWVDVDPSWEGGRVDAAHIKTGQGLLTSAQLPRLNLPLQLLLAAADTLELVEYTAAGQRFSGAAETVFLAAEAADRHFEVERAQELYHEVVILPWNHRSSEALMQIGLYHFRRQRPDEARWALERIGVLEPSGDQADQALFYLSKLADEEGDLSRAKQLLTQIVQVFPDGDMADDALGRLAELAEDEAGCTAAEPFYQQLEREYGTSGWAAVAAAKLERCRSGEVDGSGL